MMRTWTGARLADALLWLQLLHKSQSKEENLPRKKLREFRFRSRPVAAGILRFSFVFTSIIFLVDSSQHSSDPEGVHGVVPKHYNEFNTLDTKYLLQDRIATKIAGDRIVGPTTAPPSNLPPSPAAEKPDEGSLVKAKVEQYIINMVAREPEVSPPNPPSVSAAKDPKKIFGRKLNIPPGSSISLAVQVSRPDIFPGFFFQGDAIVMDAVIETPMWFELDSYVNHVYESRPKPQGPEGTPAGAKGFIGYERCFLYEQIETLIARTMEIPPATAHACLVRTICEIHALLSFRPDFVGGSVVFELMRLFLTPSLGGENDCFTPYLTAEVTGKKNVLCQSYNKGCPVSFAYMIFSNFVNVNY